MVYSTEIPGNYIKKPMRECTGVEITEEWLYHMGVPESRFTIWLQNLQSLSLV